MYRVHIWMRKKEDMSSEDFLEYWLNSHAPIARDGYAGLKGYVVHVVTGAPRDAMHSRKFFMCARMAGATWRSRSFSVRSSGN